MRIAKHIRVSGALPLAAALALLTGCGDGRKEPSAVERLVPRPVKLMTVGEPQDGESRYYPAKVRANQRVKLGFQVSGQIINFPVKSGDRVKAGQILAELDPRDFENTLKSATARHRENKSVFERQSKLLDMHVVSIASFEPRHTAYEVSESDMRTAQKALDDTSLKAPFDGVVAGTFAEKFQNVKAQEVVVSLQDISHIELLINVPEKDVIRSTSGMTIDEANSKLAFRAVFPSLGETSFPLKLKEFETEADPGTQTFKAVMSMPAPERANIIRG